MSSPKKVPNRPTKRTLVRWDDNLDELLLLTIQSVCNQHGVKIPWTEVAKTMKHGVTEGAIVQHLAKLRTRRVTAEKAVPPPLRRGGVGSTSTKSVEPRQKSKQTMLLKMPEEAPIVIPAIDHSSDEDYEPVSKRRLRRGPKTKPRISKKVEIKTEPESVDETQSDYYETDDLLVPGAAFLDLPNDRDSASTTSPSVATSSHAEESRVIVLKYARRAGNPASETQWASRCIEHYPTSPYLNSFSNGHLQQHSSNTTIPSTSYNTGLGNENATNGQYISYSTSPVELSSFSEEYGLTPIHGFDSSVDVGGLPTPSSQWLYHGNPSRGASEALGSASELIGHDSGFLDDDNYKFLYHNYMNVDSNDDMTWATKCE
ncbi:hypothetical protein FE257_002752 [Aspergillus nanangensis]|uniref:Myb-like domain-containing protein n=1 Tax=Aspergillus nanangensis TaxID=2582783 RepID=A0AAD4CC83_ASPNN|nr:hypothetical protein FE257_002752 [Aspergillus nanangensis]